MGEDSAEVRAQVRDVDRRANNSATTSTTTVGLGDVTEHPDDPIVELGTGSRAPPRSFIPDAPGSASERWKKWVPFPVRRFGEAVVTWAKGPPDARNFKIDPLLPPAQHFPVVMLAKVLPHRMHRIWLFAFWLAMWIVTFALVMRQGLVASEIAGWGTPVKISCGSTYWSGDNGCGLDGNLCRPFTDGGFAFKCPASCSSYQVLNPHAVGDQEVVYSSLVVGGPPPGIDGNAIYRGDSFICGAAIHAGVVSNAEGGCGVVRLIGTQRNFNGSSRNGISSLGFDSYFPLSFTFESAECASRDMKWPLLAVSVVFSSVISLFVTSPAAFFFPIFTGLYWTVGLATDAPNYATVPALISREVGNYLPAMFVGWVMYDKMGVRRTLRGLSAQTEKTVLWLGACWVGSLTNYTFDFIPIQRLTPHDLEQQPGARAALAIIVIVLLIIVTTQIWFFRQEARLIRYLGLYLLLGVGLIICVLLPNLNLRIHHYILALLLLPGTSMQTRPSLLYQGLLVGFFINGIARWGFDPLLQTSLALRGDAQLGSPLPIIPAPVINVGQNVSDITFNWGSPPGPEYDGISILINDVERFRTYFADEFHNPPNFTWTRRGGIEENEYFRFGWMQGSESEDYTKAGTWNTKHEWVDMAAGPSKVKARDAGTEVIVPRDFLRR
ncbi:hypothetical protein B0T16DRAFT_404297 [Cercophora newfieldiana]|uniref:LCCL domain-containing protein n=1 Tax=Cercophora newfieldiana TaxID=92897 RepID=A0AA40CWC6_9PEZI|nr:hypothetical protein B0T16DRAFT_404297 [Cercophora newfieldiana]